MILGLQLVGCSHVPSSKIDFNNACSISEFKPQWISAAQNSSKKWKVKVPTILAIVHYESSFQSDAQPKRRYLFGFIPLRRPSSALGYSQALEGTWEKYRKSTGNYRADRESFPDSVDFIGWYFQQAKKKVKITRASDFYLVYHEGIDGYLKKTFKKKKWLVERANQVSSRAELYKKQISQCQSKIALK